MQNSRVHSVSGKLPTQLDIAQIPLYERNMLSVGMFLFLTFFNLLHPSSWHQWIEKIDVFGALLAKVMTVYTGYLGFHLLWGASQILSQIYTLTFWSTVVISLGLATSARIEKSKLSREKYLHNQGSILFLTV
ncbi:hypothetical protein [Brasilonema sp. UFV-L1]|uniref:hypothetical protein n=1 Tax=Brasilonema sp. UFV-L1 TaxID=2234130 RepID=UPI00145DB1D0|nr:hypothetical protein [Brasilonema sp. UFV-L1]NMG10341.1 hypothetical protein [Brasilonema sp. UFV-L1]